MNHNTLIACTNKSHHGDGQFFHPERKQLLCLLLCQAELLVVDIQGSPALGALPQFWPTDPATIIAGARFSQLTVCILIHSVIM